MLALLCGFKRVKFGTLSDKWTESQFVFVRIVSVLRQLMCQIKGQNNCWSTGVKLYTYTIGYALYNIYLWVTHVVGNLLLLYHSEKLLRELLMFNISYEKNVKTVRLTFSMQIYNTFQKRPVLGRYCKWICSRQKRGVYWLCMLFQGLNQHLLEGWDLLQISLNVTDVNTAESALTAESSRKNSTNKSIYLPSCNIYGTVICVQWICYYVYMY